MKGFAFDNDVFSPDDLNKWINYLVTPLGTVRNMTQLILHQNMIKQSKYIMIFRGMPLTRADRRNFNE